MWQSKKTVSSILQNFGFFASQNLVLAYFIVYLTAILLGNIAGFSALWLTYGGVFGSHGFPLTFAALTLADISADLLWYALGRSLRKTRFGAWAIAHVPYHDRIEKHLHKNSRRWIFLSKFIYGSSFPIIFSAGWTKIDFQKFFRTSIIAIVIWIPFLSLITFGLFAGIAPLGAQATFRHYEYLIALGIGAFLVIDAVISRIVERAFAEEEDAP